MGKLYREFFYIPKHGKVREKVMLARTAMTVVIMVICLAAMSLTAYAYFSANVTSGSNIIKAANFEADVSIKITDPDNGTDVPVTRGENLTQTALLEKDKTYSITLTPGDSTAKTGFCVITAVGCSETCYTQQFGYDQTIKDNASSVTFTLKVTQTTYVEFMSHWGTSSCYGYADKEKNPLYIKVEDEVEMAVTPVNTFGEIPSDETQGATEETTNPTETTPTENVHTVAEDETLTAIAANYDTTVEKIVAYNKLTDKDNITVGQQLKIPPADYEIPAGSTETTTPSTTTPTESTTTTEPTTTTVPETTTEPTETTAPTETTGTPTTDVPETSVPAETNEPTATTETQPATTSPEPTSTETTGATTTEASE